MTGFERLTVAELEAFITRMTPLLNNLTKAGMISPAKRIGKMVADASAELARKMVA